MSDNSTETYSELHKEKQQFVLMSKTHIQCFKWASSGVRILTACSS